MNFKIIKSYAKVNLSLGVTGRLKSGYHKIESLISFLNLHDEIKIKKIINKNHKIQFFGKFSSKWKFNGAITINNPFKKKHTSKSRSWWWINECFCNYKIFYF